jgi:hypothetical protein
MNIFEYNFRKPLYMESPFASVSNFTVYVEPYLDTYNKEYLNIITVDKMPGGPLAPLVTQIRGEKLSPFHSHCSFSTNCILAISRYHHKGQSKKRDQFLLAEDIPSLLAFLQSNGYTVDATITKMIQRSNINIGNTACDNKKKMVCVVTYINTL